MDAFLLKIEVKKYNKKYTRILLEMIYIANFIYLAINFDYFKFKES